MDNTNKLLIDFNSRLARIEDTQVKQDEKMDEMHFDVEYHEQVIGKTEKFRAAVAKEALDLIDSNKAVLASVQTANERLTLLQSQLETFKLWAVICFSVGGVSLLYAFLGGVFK